MTFKQLIKERKNMDIMSLSRIISGNKKRNKRQNEKKEWR